MNTNAIDTTLHYYESNADTYATSTMHIDLSDTRMRFIELLPNGGKILDFGCGSGRDTLAFIKAGFIVTATDGSPELCTIATKATGIPVRNETFQELADICLYDGIWACSSILHLPKAELADVLRRIERALLPGGALYASFKFGSRDGIYDGRHFTDFNEDTLHAFINASCTLNIKETWVTPDVRPEKRNRSKWLNVLFVKPGLSVY